MYKEMSIENIGSNKTPKLKHRAQGQWQQAAANKENWRNKTDYLRVDQLFTITSGNKYFTKKRGFGPFY